jgi:putative inorganic carbon (hco3(-)) transporter
MVHHTHMADNTPPVVPTLEHPPALSHSFVFQGNEAVFSKATHLWNNSWVSSNLCAVVRKPASRGVPSTDTPHTTEWLLGVIPALGVLALLWGCTTLGTGLIGAGSIALFAWAMGISLMTGKNRWLKSPSLLDATILLFFLTYAISACFSSFTQVAFVGLAKQSIFLMAYIGLRSAWVHGASIMRLGFPLLLILGVHQTVVGWMQSNGYAGELAGWTDTTVPMDLQLSRVYGTLKPYNPNLLAAFLLSSAGASLWVMYHVACAGLRKTWPWVLLILFSLGIILYGVMLTGCRGAYVGSMVLVVAQFLWLWPILNTDTTAKQYKSLRVLWGVMATLGIVGVGAAVSTNEKLLFRIQSIFAFRGDSSISYRFNVYQSAWRMFMDNWLTGIGPSNTVFKKVYGFYMVPGFNALGAYSIPLEILVEQGIIGLGAFLSAGWVATHGAIRQMFATQHTLSSKLGIMALSTCLLATFSHGLVDTILYRPPIMVPFLFILAGLATLIETEAFQSTPKRTPVAGGGVAFVV